MAKLGDRRDHRSAAYRLQPLSAGVNEERSYLSVPPGPTVTRQCKLSPAVGRDVPHAVRVSIAAPHREDVRQGLHVLAEILDGVCDPCVLIL